MREAGVRSILREPMNKILVCSQECGPSPMVAKYVSTKLYLHVFNEKLNQTGLNRVKVGFK